MRYETEGGDELADFRNKFAAWEHQHPLYDFLTLNASFSPAKLWNMAGGDGPLYRDFMKVVGHIIPAAHKAGDSAQGRFR